VALRTGVQARERDAGASSFFNGRSLRESNSRPKKLTTDVYECRLPSLSHLGFVRRQSLPKPVDVLSQDLSTSSRSTPNYLTSIPLSRGEELIETWPAYWGQ
jgi:hypothetical protein